MATTAEPTTLAARLVALMEAGADPWDAVDEAFALMDRDELAAAARPAVVWQAIRLERALVRRREATAFNAAGRAKVDALPTNEAPASQPDALREILRDGFALPDGRRVTWATATREDHLARAAWLRRHARAVEVTAGRHELVAKWLKAAKAETLADLLARGV